MNKTIIIGKRGFLGNSLHKYLSAKTKCRLISFKDFKNNKLKEKNYSHIINCSIDFNYINKKYHERFDNDLKISSLIKGNKAKLIFLSSRKIYKSGPNLKENSRLNPKSNYSKNKLITERKLLKILKGRLVILRVSNIIGDKSKTKNLHNTFVDTFFKNAKMGLIFNNKHQYKDFISIEKFNEIVFHIIKKNLRGIYNVSIGRKINTNSLISWLNYYNKKKCRVKNIKKNQQSFYLNNNKIMKKIRIKNSISDLKNYCLKLSKKNFSF
tara:strand:+ start:344 stop:1147 length:804 start_codon:yes stop_codon:yes gene_type:complete